MKNKTVEVGMFAYVKDTKLSEYGVFKGDTVYVAGDMFLPDEKDPYSYRKMFIGAFVKDGHILIHDKPFTVDGKRLEPVSKVNQEKLDAIKEADFGEKANADQDIQ
ncbi:hypothetical protein D3C85_346220 [compost metagenome]